MKTIEPEALDQDSVSYDGPPIAEICVDDLEYRVDVGLGAIVAISRREAGAISWVAVAQGRWDGVRLRAKALDRSVVMPLEQALALAMRAREEGFS